jgi:hypothetical protein
MGIGNKWVAIMVHCPVWGIGVREAIPSTKRPYGRSQDRNLRPCLSHDAPRRSRGSFVASGFEFGQYRRRLRKYCMEACWVNSAGIPRGFYRPEAPAMSGSNVCIALPDAGTRRELSVRRICHSNHGRTRDCLTELAIEIKRNHKPCCGIGIA